VGLGDLGGINNGKGIDFSKKFLLADLAVIVEIEIVIKFFTNSGPGLINLTHCGDAIKFSEGEKSVGIVINFVKAKGASRFDLVPDGRFGGFAFGVGDFTITVGVPAVFYATFAVFGATPALFPEILAILAVRAESL
jgi:hypothetical protein